MSSHTALKRRVIAALRGAGCLVTSYNGSTAGVLDLFICTPEGRYVELDIKVGRDKLSRLQHHRITQVQQAGGEAAEVRSVGEAHWHCGLAPPQTEPPPLVVSLDEDIVQSASVRLVCPDCGAIPRGASGCLECPSCGWSACEV